MAHLNYNHLYYFWMACHKGSIARAADALFLTPQTVTGQIRHLEERLGGKLLQRSGRGVLPTDLGRLVYEYADQMFSLSFKMLDSVMYESQRHRSVSLGVSDVLYKELAAKFLHIAIGHDVTQLRCVERDHQHLIDQLASHQLDMILTDCPVDSATQAGLFSRRLGESPIAFFASKQAEIEGETLISALAQHSILLPAEKTALGRQLRYWLDEQGVDCHIIAEFDDAALMMAFAAEQPVLFPAPVVLSPWLVEQRGFKSWGEISGVSESYYLTFSERMIKHSVVRRLLEKSKDLFCL